MVSNFTTTQMQPQAVQVPVNYPASSTVPSAVNINIVSPSVYGQNASSVPYSPIYSYPQAQTLPPPPFLPSANATATAEANVQALLPPPPAKPLKKQQITPLTNEYIQSLESYMNSPDEQTRISGVKQIMARFKEDDSRKRDAALTALLNRSLNDRSGNVRVLGMTILASGYATGDNNTVGLLNRIQRESSSSSYNEDAHLASDALAQMAALANAQTINVPES